LKILFVTDIHLNLRANKAWESSRFLALFDLIAKDEADTIVIGGDTFDLAKPSLEEIKVFYEGISKLSDKKVYLISGNHENLSNTETVFDYIPHIGFTYIEDDIINFNRYSLFFVSHIKCKSIIHHKKDISLSKTNILFSHFRSNYGTFIKGEIDVLEVSKMFDFIFVGDIHHKYSPYPNVHYPSSPYGIHYEPLREYGAYRITLEDKMPVSFEHVRLHLPSKILVTNSSEEVLKGLSLLPQHLYKVVVLDSPSTKVTHLLSKNSLVGVFDYKPTEIENTEEFEKLVEDLSAHSSEDVVDTIIKLLKANEVGFPEKNESYLRGVLRDARNN